MKRYKQSILSDYFVTIGHSGPTHVVEANFDIESSQDRTLCTDVIQASWGFEVLTNKHLPTICPICNAILDRRISNMPRLKRHVLVETVKPVQLQLPVCQLGLDF
ncbi:hypothetical protein GCM10023116_37790 [Kistimonas scapharcae]|uniref:Transposase n=1 Tax=Kistimonas scapharcae TaxID=1036133 RepID=A0ABP8V634_9GAMM